MPKGDLVRRKLGWAAEADTSFLGGFTPGTGPLCGLGALDIQLVGETRLADLMTPTAWLPEYTTELLNVLHVLTRLVALEPRQDDLLGRIIASPCIDADALRASGALSEGSADESEGGGVSEDAEVQDVYGPPATLLLLSPGYCRMRLERPRRPIGRIKGVARSTNFR
jgi:hypothetical protein